MNRADIRQAIFDQIDWQPDSASDLKLKLDRFINRAYQQLALEAPFLFFEDKAYFRTQIDAKADTSITNDGLTQVTSSIQTPGLVWKRAYAITAGAPSGDDASITEWDLDPTAYVTADVPHPWDGRWIEITGSDGRVHRRRIRRIWYTEVGSTHTDYITLDHPLDLEEFSAASTEYTLLDYRIYTNSYYLPADTIEVRSLRIWAEERRELIALVYTEEAEEQWWDDIQASNSSGSPRKAFRTDFFQLPSPTLKPIPEVVVGTTWSTSYQQPQGTFDFFYTVCWGSKEKTRVISGDTSDVSQQRLPRWESAPSPVSDESTMISSAQTIALTVPDVGAPLGFTTGAGSELEHGKSGLWKRIYARRVSSDRTAAATQAIVGDSTDFFFVGWVDGQTTTFQFNGHLLNEAEPHRDTHGYSGIQLSPLPDAAYDVDIRYLRKPHPLNDDQAVPRIPPESLPVLVQKAIALVYESLGNMDLAAVALSIYERHLVTLTKRYGSLPTGVFRKRLGRARSRGRRGYRFLVDER
mgnify:CR=1 FL=1